jgi:twitching motility protein PilT
MARIDALFNLMFEQKASDLHLSSGNPPILRINGELTRVDYPPLEDDQLKIMLYEIAPEYKIKTFEETGDVDFGYEIAGVSRFRANFFTQKYGIAAVFRQIPSKVLSFEDFEKFDAPLPAVLKKFAMLHKGLVVVTGPTGSGKSTTLAAIVDYANKNRRDHIITVEDPIEFVHESKSCLVNHREVGLHTKSFAAALRGALREDPDIILVGELRDLETIELALTAASTGHLVFGTLHTQSAAKTVDRIIDVFRRPAKQNPRHAFRSAQRGGGAEPVQAGRPQGPRGGAGNPDFQHGGGQPGARRQDPPDSRHDPGRQEIRQHAAGRFDHGPSQDEAHFAGGGLRQVH